MSFAPELVTEREARSRLSATALLVREHRGLGSYLLMAVIGIAAWAGVTFPFWRYQVPLETHFPNFLAMLIGGVLLIFWNLMRLDLKAARQDVSWPLASDRGKLFVHFRSFHHWFWPVEDRTVLVLDRFDIDIMEPAEGKLVETTRQIINSYDTTNKQFRSSIDRRSSARMLRNIRINLREKLPQHVVDTLIHENKRVYGKGKKRGRYQHSPVEASADGMSLLLHLGEISPDFDGLLTQLQQQGFPLKAIRDISERRDFSPASLVLTEKVLDEIDRMGRMGDTIGAVRLLREYVPLSLSEARDIVEKGARQKLADRIKN